MPRTVAHYAYRAYSLDGEPLEGELAAADEAAAMRHLEEMGYVTTRVVPVAAPADRGGLGPSIRTLPRWLDRAPGSHLARVTRELVMVLETGEGLDSALDMVARTLPSRRLREALESSVRALREGTAWSEALAREGGVFPPFYLAMVRAAEAGGELVPILTRLADALERRDRSREAVRAALTYPMVLVLVATLSLVVLLAVVTPQFRTLFDDLGTDMPLVTEILFGLGEGLRSYGPMFVVGVVALAWIGPRWIARPSRRWHWDRVVLGAPLIGRVVALTETGRFCATLSALVSSRVPFDEALGAARDVVQNTVLRNVVEYAGRNARQGRSFAGALAESGAFGPLVTHVIATGERSGQLATALSHAAEICEHEAHRRTARMVSYVEPALILAIGGAIAVVVLALLAGIQELGAVGYG